MLGNIKHYLTLGLFLVEVSKFISRDEPVAVDVEAAEPAE